MSGTRARLRPVAALLFPLFLVLLQAAVLDAGGLPAAAALAAVGAALVTCAVLAARCVPAVPPTRVRTALRDRAHRTAFLPQRDPDASGRTRPRAPGRALAATA
ncbi:DUF6412 domain-containing protein [Streptomyces sp. B3I8]|uniref:DUF6412 domain-containing protein n=1 Tax=Streptomyces sp. B3I8 TaxID=3042303 RepID=UPI0027895425|nr:DUF6412 domain-containing protein [Streptomyces sp. B3I8]MDQ0787175.1 hypothetical protein [Streptomyces sp. B3I8]